MVFPRLIPLLLVHGGRLEKSRRFGDWRYVGDVLNAIKIFNEKDVDELIVLDVDAARTGRGPDFALLEQLAGECFMPLAYGGGVESADTARRIMRLGIEKVVINGAAMRRPSLITEVSDVLGASSTVVSIDATMSRRGAVRFDHRTGAAVKKESIADRIAEVVAAGAGELVIQSRDRDGTLDGPDLALIREVTSSVSVPVVYGGGISSLADCEAVWSAGVSGVAAGSWFVFRGPHRAVVITYPRYDLITDAFERVAAAR